MAESVIKAKMAHSQQLIYRGYTENTFSVSIPNYENYEMLVIVISGDANNGITLTVPRALYHNVQLPFSVYSSAGSPIPISSGYSIACQGSYSDGHVNVSYATSGSWGRTLVTVFGIN